jgi:hypothetical protein
MIPDVSTDAAIPQELLTLEDIVGCCHGCPLVGDERSNPKD